MVACTGGGSEDGEKMPVLGMFLEPMGLANGLDVWGEGKDGVRVPPSTGELDGE